MLNVVSIHIYYKDKGDEERTSYHSVVHKQIWGVESDQIAVSDLSSISF